MLHRIGVIHKDGLVDTYRLRQYYVNCPSKVFAIDIVGHTAPRSRSGWLRKDEALAATALRRDPDLLRRPCRASPHS